MSGNSADTMAISPTQTRTLLKKISGLRILVIGDSYRRVQIACEAWFRAHRYGQPTHQRPGLSVQGEQSRNLSQ